MDTRNGWQTPSSKLAMKGVVTAVRLVVRLLSMLVVLAACSGVLPTTNTDFAAPSGMALAGPQFDQVFIANQAIDSLQVLALGQPLVNVDMQPAPARYFPLFIPAGPNPTEVVASSDGRYVFVLDAVGSTLRVVDATALNLVRDANGVALSMGVGPTDASTRGLVASPIPCLSSLPGTTCLGRVYVTIQSASSIASVDLLQGPDGKLDLVGSNFISVGGAPDRLAMHPSGNSIYATDAAAAELVVVDLSQATPQVNRVPIDYIGGPVAVSQTGNMILVGRPLVKDLLILNSNTLTAIDADPVFAPLPQCLQACTDANALCLSAHPADQALCTLGDGLAQGQGVNYGALYLGGIPAQITAVATASNPMTIPCIDANKTYSDAVAVATLEGSVYFVGLQAIDGSQQVELASSDYCNGPSLVYDRTQQPPSNYLAACPQVPSRARFSCITQADPPVADVGITALPGLTQGLTWSLTWEPSLPGMDRSSGGGVVGPDGRFGDISGYPPDANFIVAQTSQVPGDILLLETAPRGGCVDAEQCWQEHRITAVQAEGSVLWLTLDVPLHPDCFESGGVLAYRILAGNSFAVTQLNGSPQPPLARVRPGETYGLGAFGGQGAPALFTLQNFQQDTASPGCQIYTGNGSVVAGAAQNALLARNMSLIFSVSDPYQPVRKGLQYDPLTGNLLGTVGQLPAGILMTQQVGDTPPLLLISFAGSDTILASNPANTGTLLFDDLANKLLH